MNDQTRAFTKRFNERYKKSPPTMVHAGVYSSLIHYFKALEALGGNPHDGRAIVAKMKEMPTDDALFGKGSIRADGRKIHPAYLFEVKSRRSRNTRSTLQAGRDHSGGRSLYSAREERLLAGEEELICVKPNQRRHGRACPGHPRRTSCDCARLVCPGQPGMTNRVASLPLVEIHIQAVAELILRQLGRRPRHRIGAADHRDRRLVEGGIAG